MGREYRIVEIYVQRSQSELCGVFEITSTVSVYGCVLDFNLEDSDRYRDSAMIIVGTPLICIESHPASCLIVGKTYYVASISGNIVQLDNNVWTYLSRFKVTNPQFV
jgi:hypothetical protein